METLRITEIFYSIQGESNTIGLPTVFVRLTGCPLRCTYCDTAYAFSGGEHLSLDAIVCEVGQYNTRFVTVTGGEPLAQNACYALLKMLADEGYHVSLETSGAIDISKVDSRIIKIMDLKAPGSAEEHRNCYQNLDYLDTKDQVKFVIGCETDYEWAKQKLTALRLVERCEVLFSPVTGLMPPSELADRILQDQLNVRFQVQLHKVLWGDVAGR